MAKNKGYAGDLVETVELVDKDGNKIEFSDDVMDAEDVTEDLVEVPEEEE